MDKMLLATHVLGFAFTPDLSKVVLLRKNKPAWAAGRLNGLGGSIEKGETELDAMCREFQEECGLSTSHADWHYIGQLEGPDWSVSCFAAKVDQAAHARTMESETVCVLSVSDYLKASATDNGLSDLDSVWLVPFARRYLAQPERRATFKANFPTYT